MGGVDASFEDVADKWRAYEDKVRGALRYDLSQENISLYLSDCPPLRILDLGAGTGPVSAWLAKKGHSVVAVEPSAKNLKLAQERFANLSDEQRSRIETIEGDVSSLEARHGSESFDWVVSHCLAMYQEDPAVYWRAAWRQLRHGGRMSVLESGYIATMNDLILGDDETAAALQRFKDTGWYTNSMGHEARAFKFSDIERIFIPLGAIVLLRAGVRFEEGDSIHTSVRDFDPDEYQRILCEERLLGQDPEAMKRAQMLQLILEKR